jgi:hypothetical protein
MQWHDAMHVIDGDSDFSNCHPPTIYLLSAGVELVSAITLWPLVWRGCEVRVREQTYLLLLEPAVCENFLWTRRVFQKFLPQTSHKLKNKTKQNPTLLKK